MNELNALKQYFKHIGLNQCLLSISNPFSSYWKGDHNVMLVELD